MVGNSARCTPFVYAHRRLCLRCIPAVRPRREHGSRLRGAHRRRRPQGLDARGAPWLFTNPETAERVGLQSYLRPLPWNRIGSGPSWKSARGAPIACTTLDGQPSYRRAPAPVRPVRHDACARCSPPGEPSTSRLPGSVIGRKWTLLCPHGPHDPGEFIGHRDRRHVVSATLLGLHRPALQRRRVSRHLRVPQE